MSANLSNIRGDSCPNPVNFCLPVKDLDTARVKLTPFIPSRHAQKFFDGSKFHPELYHYLTFGPFETIRDFEEWYQSRIQSNSANVLFAIIDKTQAQARQGEPNILQESHDNVVAGIIGLLETAPSQARAELGFAITLPNFQRTHVTKSAAGLLLQYCLDLPESGGLGLRRVEWRANAENMASIRAAEKLGFVKEGLFRWHWVLPAHKEGKKSREGDPVSGPRRDTVVLAMCWDDWEAKKGTVCGLMR